MLLRNDVEMNGEAIMLFVVIIDKTRIFENISAFKFVLPCISRVMVRNGCEGNGGGHYVIIIILYRFSSTFITSMCRRY